MTRCSKCAAPISPERHGQRYCLVCHAAYMREWRKSHPLTDEQRRRDNCRSYAGVYLRRGLLIRQPCEDCRSPNSEMHHDDYNQPLVVRWLCRLCHLILHKEELTEGLETCP